jgi:hypothetical protein
VLVFAGQACAHVCHRGVLKLDLVIYDRQYSPLLFNQDGALYVPAESVYAVLEVKPELDKGTVEYAGKKAASVRALKRTSVPVPHAGGVFEPRKLFEILAGIVALESSWKPPFGDSLLDVLHGSPLFLRLLGRLQSLGTVPALDLTEYGRSLES